MARILIVDDEKSIRETLREILDYEGYEIEEAEDGEKALNLIKKFEGLHRVQPDGMVSAYRCPAGVWTLGFGSTYGVKSGH